MTYPVAMMVEAAKLRGHGHSYREIGETLGVSAKTVRIWLDFHAHDQHVETNRRYRARSRYVAGTRVLTTTGEKMLAMRRDYGMSYAGIAGAVAAYEGRRYARVTVRKVLRILCPDLPDKPRGVPFVAGDPRRVAA